MDLKDKKVLVIGLGRSGIAAARYLANEGACVIAADIKDASELTQAISALKGMGVKFRFGHDSLKLDDTCDMIVASPGVPLDLPGLTLLRAKGIPIIGELELASYKITRPIIAVTGTNGKTTTTSLIGHLLNKAGISACVAGNIGTPLIDVIDEAQRSDYVVVEVSSFQMDTAPTFPAHIAVWLNATCDHIDRHGTFENYVASKAKLFAQMPSHGIGIYNAADDSVSHAVTASSCKLIPFDATGNLLARAHHHHGTADGFAWYESGSLCVRIGAETAHRYPLSKTTLPGPHNRENMLAALLAARLAGASYDALISGLLSFAGLAHRVQFIGEHMGVRYFDDSKGTNVGATMRALDVFSEPVVLIAGGRSKGTDFSPLAPQIKGKVKKLILIGEAADEMQTIFGMHTSTTKADSMDEAVKKASIAAEVGDVVLLSPACASFDMFKDYAERGNAFSDAVMRLSKKT
ncbi:MAG: UDP-N-acetylmuramoyl-L-alanine--D-glutamate ligase [Pseudomonadota bacterium]